MNGKKETHAAAGRPMPLRKEEKYAVRNKAICGFHNTCLNSPIWQDDAVFKLYLYYLSKASHNSCVWRGIQIEPGDLPVSERHMTEALRWSRCKVQRNMGELCKIGLISKTTVSTRGTMIHITGWLHKKTGDPEAGFTADPYCTGDESGSHGDLPENWVRHDTGLCQDSPEPSPVLYHSESSFTDKGSTVIPDPITNRCSSSWLSGFEPNGFKEIRYHILPFAENIISKNDNLIP